MLSTPTGAVLLAAMIGTSSATAASWDSAAGVWRGDRALAAGDIPDPLWIFGYGSLCFKLDQSFESGVEASFIGRVQGWGRYFAQASADHRGTPESPGLVATLLNDPDLERLGKRAAGAGPPSSTIGVCYKIAPQHADAVLDALDFRERGGYTRQVIEVEPAVAQAGGGEKAPVLALLYTATPENPGFSHSALLDVRGAAATIKSAVGPSGANIDYLRGLAEWLRTNQLTDEHVEALMQHVAELEGQAPGLAEDHDP